MSVEKKHSHRHLFEYGKLTKAVLSHIVDSILVGYSSIENRRGGLSFTKIFETVDYLLKVIKNKKKKERKILRVLQSLEKEEIIDLIEKDGEVIVKLKNKNHPKIIKYSIKNLLNFKIREKKWQKKWFFVFFDVPEIQHNKRDYLRKFLKDLGFYCYQQSVYVFPFECKKEVFLIKKIVESAKYMKYIVAEEIEDEDKIKKYFGIKD